MSVSQSEQGCVQFERAVGKNEKLESFKLENFKLESLKLESFDEVGKSQAKETRIPSEQNRSHKIELL